MREEKDRTPSDAETDDPFLQSLQTLSRSDIVSESSPKKERRFSPVRFGAIVLCGLVLAYSLFQIGQQIFEYMRTGQIYDQLAQNFYDDAVHFDSGNGAVARLQSSLSAIPALKWSERETAGQNTSYETTVNTAFEALRAKLSYLSGINSDTYGWVSIADTRIDYPVVQGEDNDYYLTHAFTRVGLSAGSVFVDYRCLRNLSSNYNVILYGHNMYDGTMFHDVELYMDEDFFFSHPYITVTTVDGVFTYEVFAIYQADKSSGYNCTGFADREAFLEYAYDAEAKSVYHRPGITFNENDRLLTLSTCTSTTSIFNRNRYALQAKLIRAELAS